MSRLLMLSLRWRLFPDGSWEFADEDIGRSNPPISFGLIMFSLLWMVPTEYKDFWARLGPL